MKDFDTWNDLKKSLQTAAEKQFHFCEREIWWCSLGNNLGYEQDGKNLLYERPVLIFKKFNKYVSWVLPLTSKNRTGKYYAEIIHGGHTSTVLLSQLRLISSKRLNRIMGKISAFQFSKIRELLLALL